MKGISAVIAAILMLMITMALACVAYFYISGIFARQTAVVLEIVDATCIGNPIDVIVRNLGTDVSGIVNVSAKAPDGAIAGATSAESRCAIMSISSGITGNCSIFRAANKPAGIYTITVTSTPGMRTERGTVSCVTVAT